MNQYTYIARDKEGRKIKNIIDGNNETEVKQKLYELDYVILDLREKRTGNRNVKSDTVKNSFLGRIKAQDKAVFARQFAILLDTGIPLNDALEYLRNTSKNQKLKKVLGEVKKKVEEGQTLSEAMSGYPRIFTPLFIYMIAAGEQSGSLSYVMNVMADDMEKDGVIVGKIKGALVEPAILTLGGIVTIYIMMTKIVPAFQTFFDDMGAELPWITQVVVNISNFLINYGLYVILGLITLIILMIQFNKTPQGRLIFDTIKVKFPKVGPVFMKVAVLRFARTLENLTKSDVPLMDSLDVVGLTSGNALVEKAVKQIQKDVQGGRRMNDSMASTKVFPDLLVEMLSIGEESGRMAEVMGKITEYYQREVDQILDNLVKIINPIATLLLGVIIGAIAVAIIAPNFAMLGAMSSGM